MILASPFPLMQYSVITIKIQLTTQVNQAWASKVYENEIPQVSPAREEGEAVGRGGSESAIAVLIGRPGHGSRITAGCRPEKPGQTGVDEGLEV